MIKDLVIVGAGGLARELESVIQDINTASKTYNFLGFIDNDKANIGKSLGNSFIVGTEEDLSKMDVAVAIGIGNPSIIAKVAKEIRAYPNLHFPNIVHPSVVWHPERTSIGEGNVFCAGNVFTVEIKFGSFNFINLSCTIGHDTQFEDYCLVNPGANISGGVKVGSRSLIGTGATVLQYKNIGEASTVGAGAVLTKDVQAGTTVVGNPAKELLR